MIETQLCHFPDRFTVEYVRTFPHPLERVWRALTEPEELSVWAMPARVDLRVGGAYSFMGEQWGTILALAPPRFIKFGKRGIDADPGAPGENYMQYQLDAVSGGTRMTFTEHWKERPGLPRLGHRQVRSRGGRRPSRRPSESLPSRHPRRLAWNVCWRKAATKKSACARRP